MTEFNSEKKPLDVEEIMARIREKIKQEQKTQDLPKEPETSREAPDSSEADQEAFWTEHKKNIEFHFWNQHLLSINNLWKELLTEEQLESEETKVVKFELWHHFLTALNQKWQLTQVRNLLLPSSRPLIGRVFDFLRLKVYAWLDPVFDAQQTFNSTLVQFANELVERIVRMIERILRLERKLDKQRALSGEAVKFYNTVVRFLTEEMTRIDRKVDRETFRIDGTLIHLERRLAHESKRVDDLSSISSYCAFMEHRQEIMEVQIKELQSKIQELEKKLNP